MSVSAHGTTLTINGVAFPDLGPLTLPALTRKAVDDSRLIEDDERWEPGIRRMGEMQFEYPFLTLPTVLALFTAWETGTRDDYVVTLPDNGFTWSFSGFVTSLTPKAPVDDRLHMLVSVRPTEGVVFGPNIGPWILTEQDGRLVLETSDGFLRLE